jgi:hypothetical protein
MNEQKKMYSLGLETWWYAAFLCAIKELGDIRATDTVIVRDLQSKAWTANISLVLC